MRLIFVFLLSCHVLLSACSRFEKRHAPSNIDISSPDAWLSSAQEQADILWVNEGQYPTLLSQLSPSLQAMVSEALAHNQDLRVAAERVAIEAAGRRIDTADRWPDLSLRVAGREQERSVRAGEIERDRLRSAGLSSRWELDIWGKLKNASQASALDYVSETAAYHYARQSLIANVVLAWLDVWESAHLASSAMANLDLQSQRLAQFERRMDSGLADILDIRLTRNNVASLRARYLQLNENYEREQRQLESLLGRYPGAELEARSMLPELQVVSLVHNPLTLIQARPDLQASEYQLMAARLRVKEARKRLLPQLTLNGSWGGSGETLEQAFNINNWLTDFSAALLQPLFQGGALKAAVTQQRARAEIAVANYEKTVLNAWREVEEYLAGEANTQQREAALQEAFLESKAAEKLTERNYEQGLASSFEWLTARNRTINAEADLIRAQADTVTNRVRLYLALSLNIE